MSQCSCDKQPQVQWCKTLFPLSYWAQNSETKGATRLAPHVGSRGESVSLSLNLIENALVTVSSSIFRVRLSRCIPGPWAPSIFTVPHSGPKYLPVQSSFLLPCLWQQSLSWKSPVMTLVLKRSHIHYLGGGAKWQTSLGTHYLVHPRCQCLLLGV